MGKEEQLAAPPRAYQQPRFSPDGTRIAVSSTDQEQDIWIWDLRRTRLTRLTLDPSREWFPAWTPDGRRIVFSSTRRRPAQSVVAGGRQHRRGRATDDEQQFPVWSPGSRRRGTAVLFFESTPTMGRDLLQVALDGTRRVTPLLQTKFDELNGIVSPDGRWLAYESDNSGRSKSTSSPFRTSAAASGKSRRAAARNRSGRGATRNSSISVPMVRCYGCLWRRAARLGTAARRRSSSRDAT